VSPPAVTKPPSTIYDIGDYLSLANRSLRSYAASAPSPPCETRSQILKPNKYGDWISHRDEGFEELIPLAPEKKFDVAEPTACFSLSALTDVKTQP
jgi:predicted helicase